MAHPKVLIVQRSFKKTDVKKLFAAYLQNKRFDLFDFVLLSQIVSESGYSRDEELG